MARILVVDDEEDMRLAINRVLTRRGHRVREAPDGESALAAVRREAPDLVLLDMRLPGMDDLQTLKRIREMKPALPVIMVSGYGSAESAAEAMRLGASRYLAKPFTNEALLESVERLLSVGEDVLVESPEDAVRSSVSREEPLPPAPPASLSREAGQGRGEGLSARRAAWVVGGLSAAALLAWALLPRPLSRPRSYALAFAHPSALAWAGERLWSTDWLGAAVYEQSVGPGGVAVLRAVPLPQAHLTALAVAKDEIFVADAWRREIQRRRLDERLSLVRAVPSPGPDPSALFFDGRYLWSADASEGRIYQHELDDRLTVVASFRAPGRRPVGLFTDGRYFWSADADSRLLYRHRLDRDLRVLAEYRWPELNAGREPLSCFAQRGGVVWLARDGAARLFAVPLSSFQVRELP
ncbi:MAG: response regulator [Elusimicrobia bacterium]|nr:response regulator [Elusimicrobiota bacterium]